MASTYLTRTPSGSGSQRKFTFSFWVKRSGLSSQQHIFTQYSGSLGDRQFRIEFQANDTMRIYNTDGPTDWILFVTNRVFRDSSAWMHIVVAIDTTQSTESNRVKIYINGSQETSFSTSIYPSLNRDLDISTTAAQVIGALSSSSVSSYFDGSLTHFHFIDNTQYQASDFGETDSTSGIWKPKTAPSVTYGTNGFFLKMENSGAMGTDSSGNGNNFTVSGTLTQNLDTPSNNFCTMNPLRPNNISQTYSNGNNTFVRTGTGGQMNGTLGVMSGKWYYECLIDDYWQYLGWTAPSLNTSQTAACSDSGSGFYGLYSNATEVYTYANGSNTSQGSYTAMASGQIWGIAFDADNAKMYFSVNGVWENSSDPANQTNPAMSNIPVTDFLVPAIGQGTGSRSSTIKLNFGSGYFGTTAVASANADANGHGAMEYAVPSGYYTLNTKNIKEFG